MPVHTNLGSIPLMANTYAHFFRRLTPQRQDGSHDDVHSHDSSMAENDASRATALSAYLECDAIDEYNFQVQTALLSTKVIKYLEKEDLTHQKTASKLRHFSKSSYHSQGSSAIFGPQQSPLSSGLFPTVARTRSSSWISTQSFRGASGPARSPAASYMEGPLLDKILQNHSTENPVPSHEIMKMMSLLTNLHSYCPDANSVGAPMGATCTVSDYTQVIASPDAMTRLVVLIRTMLEDRYPSPLISATVPPNGRLIVCGDTHAQLQDVMWVFFKNGVPSPSNVYVFNGDICDRGGHAVEIFLILFLFKLNNPNSVHIVRGNHEDDYCNIYYGFLTELKHKFGPLPGGNMHSEFLQLFYSLPLACLIDSWAGNYKCNVTGAQIELALSPPSDDAGDTTGSPKTSSSNGTEVILKRKDAGSGHRASVRGDHLVFEKRIAYRSLSSEGVNTLTWGSNTADSWDYTSPRILVLHGGIPVPPSQSTSPSASVLLKHFKDLPHRMKIPPGPKTVLEQWMYQILWSDPAEVDGPKGRGTPFLAHHTKAFADSNNLAAVIRAHQVPANQRGVSFHHKQRLVTIFTASNYCGTSQNYGGVAIFTPSLFPTLALNKTLFEHWAPPLSVIRDNWNKHQNATQDVRMFIAHEIETERAPMDRASAGTLSHLEQKVAEYVTSLIVQNKRQLWASFFGKPRIKKNAGPVIHVEDWIDVCNAVIGHHFPWRALLAQLEVDLVDRVGIDFAAFLGRFKAGVRFGESVVDTWESAVVRGFFHELVCKDQLVQTALLHELEKARTISAERLKELILTNCPSISAPQATVFAQCLTESSGSTAVEISHVFQCVSEYVRSYFALIDTAPDAIQSEAVIQVGRTAIEFFGKLRLAILKTSHAPGDPIVGFFHKVLAGGKHEWNVPVAEASKRLERVLTELGLEAYISIAASCLYFISSDENEAVSPSDDSSLSLLKFYAGCYMDGSVAGEKVRNRIAEHATAAVYFHRNALRCASVHLDKSRCGQIDRHSFQRALVALNNSLDAEWRLTKHQLRCAIEYLRWQETVVQDEGGGVANEMMLVASSAEEEDKLLAIEYDVFLDSFEISDCERMSRACSFGWHLVKDSVAGLPSDFTLGDSLMLG